MAKRKTTTKKAVPKAVNPAVMKAVWHLNHGRYEEAIHTVRSVDAEQAAEMKAWLEKIHDAIMGMADD